MIQRFVVGILIASLLCGCGGVDGPVPPNEAPTLATTTPAGGSSGAGVDTVVRATFSEPVQFSSFVVAGRNAAALRGASSGAGTDTLVFTPSRKLEYGTTYSVTITDVKDMAGVSFASNGGHVSWTFTIGPPVFSYVSTPTAHGGDEGSYSSIFHTPVDGAVIAYYNAGDASIKMLSTGDGGKTFVQQPYYFSSANAQDDNIVLLGDDVNHMYHLVYLHKTDGLLYVSNDDLGENDVVSEWTPVAVDAGISGKAYASMVIDGSGNVHVSYYDAANTALKYATNATGTGAWNREVVDSGLAGDDPGRYSSIAVDENGLVHISYYDYHASIANGNLKYARRDAAGAWEVRAVDTTGDVGLYSSLALYGGSVYIMYYDAGNMSIKLISNETGAWKSAVIVENVPSATACPLVIGDNGVKYFSYFENCGGDSDIDLCFGAVGLETLIDVVIDDSGIGNGVQMGLTFDADGRAHISYYDATDKDLKYARQTSQ